MEAPKQHAKCNGCATAVLQNKTKLADDEHDDKYDYEQVLCDLCKEALYCSEKCETADLYVHVLSLKAKITDSLNSLSHRDNCKVKAQERVLAMQKKCFVCDKHIEGEGVHCGDCGRIKYCSANCQNADK